MILSAIEVDELKQAPRVEGVSAVHQRWSARSCSEREVFPTDLTRGFEAARWAASSNNEQPWRFLMGARNSIAHKKVASALAGLN